MMPCGKTAQTAISILSLLAERFDGGKTCLSSLEISKERDISQTLVAKLLTQLSTAGIVDGSRGPGGGYWLARNPKKISFGEIVAVFEKESDGIMCPFGPNWCGNNDPCPLHNTLLTLNQQWTDFLEKSNLGMFVVS